MLLFTTNLSVNKQCSIFINNISAVINIFGMHFVIEIPFGISTFVCCLLLNRFPLCLVFLMTFTEFHILSSCAHYHRPKLVWLCSCARWICCLLQLLLLLLCCLNYLPVRKVQRGETVKMFPNVPGGCPCICAPYCRDLYTVLIQGASVGSMHLAHVKLQLRQALFFVFVAVTLFLVVRCQQIMNNVTWNVKTKSKWNNAQWGHTRRSNVL